MNKRTIIQLGRIGDILTLIPAINEPVRWIVKPEWAHLLYSEPLIETIEWPGTVAEAVQAFPKAIVTQVDQNPNPWPRHLNHNFQHEMWTRYGLGINDLINRPLNLEWRPWQGPIGRVPTILLHTEAVSAPYKEGRQLKESLSKVPGYELWDISGTRTSDIRDMCGLMEEVKERGGVLVTVDTALLHLAYAVGIPTIALVNSDYWLAPISRAHWLARVTYERSYQQGGRQFIREKLIEYSTTTATTRNQ